ncbi:MAG: hypothetical protein JNJ54_03555 [Myxococcaceae bacterium]|nr:hypothetical protein [Myxococcaceae bacterium]
MLTSLVSLLAAASPCPAGWEPLTSPGCFRRGEGPGVVLYLHGMLAPNERAFARELGFITPAAVEAQLTLIAPRGAPGLCDWAPEYKDWWCWPSAKGREPDTTIIIERLVESIAEVERRLDRRLPAPLIAGYSNGGYFTSLLMEGRLPATGFAVLHGGLVSGVTLDERPRPILLVAAEGDTIQRPGMEAFRRALTERHWTPAFVLRKKEHPLELEDFTHLASFARRLSWKPVGGATSAAGR